MILRTFLFVALIYQVYATKCYECTSAETVECGDPVNVNKINSTDCGDNVGCIKYKIVKDLVIRGCEGDIETADCDNDNAYVEEIICKKCSDDYCNTSSRNDLSAVTLSAICVFKLICNYLNNIG